MSLTWLVPQTGCRDLPEDVYEALLDLNLYIHPAEDGSMGAFPFPWDAGFSLDNEGRTFVLCGGAGPSGWGTARVSFPVADWEIAGVVIETTDPIPAELAQRIRALGWAVL